MNSDHNPCTLNTPSIIFQVYKFSSNEIASNEEFIIKMLNKGYNVPRFQYNIITTPRIKHSLAEDLMIKSKDACYAVFCFSNEKDNDPTAEIGLDEDAEKTRAKLLSKFPNLDPSNHQLVEDVNNIKFPSSAINRFLGMGCLKPYKGHPSEYELTGFVSFYPKVGSILINLLESFAINRLHGSCIWVLAITEHELREMYEKWGYNFLEKVLIPLAKDDQVVSASLENDIGATQDFHLDVMKKILL